MNAAPWLRWFPAPNVQQSVIATLTCALWWQIDCFHKPGVDSLSLSLSLSHSLFYYLVMVFSEQADLNIPLMLAKKRKLCLNICYIGILCCVQKRSFLTTGWYSHRQKHVTHFGVCILRRVRKIAKSDYWFRHVCLSICLSVRPQGTTRLPRNGFSWNLIFEDFPKICRENSSLFKIWQELRVFYMKTDILFLSYLAQFFLEWEMFQAEL